MSQIDVNHLFPQENLSTLVNFEKKIGDLSFDVFQLDELTNGKPLLWMGLVVFKEHDLFNTLNIDEKRFINFITEIESLYHQANPYHNHIHAADVTQTTHFLLTTTGMGEGLTKLEIFTLLFGAMVHDVDHPGYSNIFLMKIQHPIAITHNDSSVLENHHCSVAFYTLLKEENNFIDSFSKNEFFLGTDFTRHHFFVNEFKDFIARGSPKDNEKDRLLILLITLKCADLGHTIKGYQTHHKWSHRITEEIESQTEEEIRRGIGNNSAQKTTLEHSQVSFITGLVQPLFALVPSVYPTFKICVTQLDENLEYWKRVVKHNQPQS